MAAKKNTKPKVTPFTVHARGGLNFRSEPCIKDGNVIKILPHGTVVEWAGAQEGDWYLVKLKGDKTEGYVQKAYLRSI